MQWYIWLILLIPLAVWILAQLTANQQEQKRPSSRPFPPRDPEQEPRARRSPENLEVFLEQMRRRKDAAEQAASERNAAEPVLVAEEVPSPRAVPPPLPRPVEQRRKSTPIGSKKPQRRPEPVVLAGPFSSSPGELNRTVTMPTMTPVIPQAPQALPAAAAAPDAPLALHRPEALPTKVSLPPVARMVRELLKSRQTLAAAVLLREVLDAPLCKRARRSTESRPA